jgi:hypothetical protein
VDILKYETYDRLLSEVVEAGYHVKTVRDFLKGDKETPSLVLRHDSEWDLSRTQAFANIEKARGIRSTFYFRFDTKVSNFEAMRELQKDGFEIGYHYNTLDRCGGDFDQAIALFEKELSQIRSEGITIDTVCSHGDPRVKKKGYKVNNEIFLKDKNLRNRSEILGEAYLDVDFLSLQYISDVGIRWNGGNIKTKQFISYIKQREWEVVYLLTHPDYWSKTYLRALGLRFIASSMRYLKINKIIIEIKNAINFIKIESTKILH